MTTGELVVEHDPKELMDSVFSSIDRIQAILGEKYKNIANAGLATQRSSIVCWNKVTGEHYSPVISWQDRRTVSEITQFEHLSYRIHQLTGLYINPHYGATKMRWCLDELKNDKLAVPVSLCIAPLASFVMFNLLSGKPYLVDPANASRTLLMNYKSLTWDAELLNIFSIDEKNLPKLVTTRHCFGNIMRHGHSIPLSICTGDQSAAIYSRGALANDEIFVNAGTGAFILKSSDTLPLLREEKLLASVVYADENKSDYVIEGTVNGAGRALQWMAEESGINEYETLLERWCREFIDPPVFLNAISGIGSPYWVASAQSSFSREASDPEKFVAVLESIVFLIAENIACIRRLCTGISHITLAGGLSTNPVVCQLLANITGLDVVRLEEQEATSLGVFHLLKNDGFQRTDSDSATFNPLSDQMVVNRYHQWQEMMSQRFLS